MPRILHIVQRTVKRNLAQCEIASDSASCNPVTMNLTRIRNARGLTLDDLGEMVGLSASTIQRAEIMHVTAKLDTYKKCAAALGVSLADLFCEDRSAIESEIIAAFRRLPDDRRGILLGLLRAVEAQP